MLGFIFSLLTAAGLIGATVGLLYDLTGATLPAPIAAATAAIPDLGMGLEGQIICLAVASILSWIMAAALRRAQDPRGLAPRI